MEENVSGCFFPEHSVLAKRNLSKLDRTRGKLLEVRVV